MKGSVLVTGGSRRIGRAICEMLAARGWRVLVHSRDADNPLRADFAEEGSAERLFAAAVRTAPDLCAIVNNASEFSTAATLSQAEMERMWRVNVSVPVRLAELLATSCAERHRQGVAIHLLDNRVLRQPPDADTPYAATKRMLWETVRGAARRLAPVVRVNGVAPGPVLAPADAVHREKGGAVLLSRRPLPEDVAGAVAFLMEAEAVTGTVLAVDSGQSLMD